MITTSIKLMDMLLNGEITRDELLRKLKKGGYEGEEINSLSLLSAMVLGDEFLYSDVDPDDRSRNITEDEFFEHLANELYIYR